MAIYKLYSATIYPYYEKIIHYMQNERYKTDDTDLNLGMNLNIILSNACYIEGVLEHKAKEIVMYRRMIYNKTIRPDFEIRKPMNLYFNRIEEFLEIKISQCMGLEKYSEIYKLLLGKSFTEDNLAKQQIEGIQVLFQLRNVIAHGREIHAYEDISNNEPEETFMGGYKKAETFLIKNKLLNQKFIECEAPNIFLLMTFSIILPTFLKISLIQLKTMF